MYTPTVELTNDLDNSTIDLPIWRMSVDRYHEMIAAGLLTSDDKLELLEGFLIKKMTVHPPHSYAVRRLSRFLNRLLPINYVLFVQQPITLSDSEPEPDVAVIRGDDPMYVARHPYADDAPIVLEVSDATIRQDRTQKKRIYARAGIETYWIVNLPRERVEVYTEPVGSDYKQTNIYYANQSVPVILDGEQVGEIKVEEILP